MPGQVLCCVYIAGRDGHQYPTNVFRQQFARGGSAGSSVLQCSFLEGSEAEGGNRAAGGAYGREGGCSAGSGGVEVIFTPPVYGTGASAGQT